MSAGWIAVRDADEAAARLRERGARPVVVRSAASATEPPPGALALCLAGLRATTWHRDDQTITCGVGLPLDELDALVAEGAQRTPFALPPGLGFSVGGSLAVGREGLLAGRRGGLREQVLGVDVLLPDGRRVKGGGRVVKNVTGYDLCRPHVGARGRFGVLVATTLRLGPTPRGFAALMHRADDLGSALDLARALRSTIDVPAGLVVTPASMLDEGESGWTVLVGIEGGEAARAARRERMGAAIGAAPREGGDAFARLDRALWTRADRVSLRGGVAALATLAAACVRSAPTVRVVLDLARGVLDLLLGDDDVDTAIARLDLAGACARDRLAARMPTRGDEFARRRARFGGPDAGLAALQERVRAVFDPAGALADGATP